MSLNVYTSERLIITYYASAFLEAAVQVNVRAGDDWKSVQLSRADWNDMLRAWQRGEFHNYNQTVDVSAKEG